MDPKRERTTFFMGALSLTVNDGSTTIDRVTLKATLSQVQITKPLQFSFLSKRTLNSINWWKWDSVVEWLSQIIPL